MFNYYEPMRKTFSAREEPELEEESSGWLVSEVESQTVLLFLSPMVLVRFEKHGHDRSSTSFSPA